MTCLFVRVHIKSLKQRHQYTSWPQKGRRVFYLVLCLVGRMETSSTRASWCEGKKLEENSDHVICSFSPLARRHARQWGRKRSACHVTPRLWVKEGGSLTRYCIKNTAEKNDNSEHDVFPALFAVCIDRWGAVPTYLVFEKVCLKQAQNIAVHKLDSSTAARTKHWMKQFQQDVRQ